MKIPNQTFLFDSSICTDFPFYAFCISFSIPHFSAVFFFIPPTPICIQQSDNGLTRKHWHILYSTCISTNSFLHSCFAFPLLLAEEKCAFCRSQLCKCMSVDGKAFMFTPILMVMIMCWKNTSFCSLILSFSPHTHGVCSKFKYSLSFQRTLPTHSQRQKKETKMFVDEERKITYRMFSSSYHCCLLLFFFCMCKIFKWR